MGNQSSTEETAHPAQYYEILISIKYPSDNKFHLPSDNISYNVLDSVELNSFDSEEVNIGKLTSLYKNSKTLVADNGGIISGFKDYFFKVNVKKTYKKFVMKKDGVPAKTINISHVLSKFLLTIDHVLKINILEISARKTHNGGIVETDDTLLYEFLLSSVGKIDPRALILDRV